MMRGFRHQRRRAGGGAVDPTLYNRMPWPYGGAGWDWRWGMQPAQYNPPPSTPQPKPPSTPPGTPPRPPSFPPETPPLAAPSRALPAATGIPAVAAATSASIASAMVARNRRWLPTRPTFARRNEESDANGWWYPCGTNPDGTTKLCRSDSPPDALAGATTKDTDVAQRRQFNRGGRGGHFGGGGFRGAFFPAYGYGYPYPYYPSYPYPYYPGYPYGGYPIGAYPWPYPYYYPYYGYPYYGAYFGGGGRRHHHHGGKPIGGGGGAMPVAGGLAPAQGGARVTQFAPIAGRGGSSPRRNPKRDREPLELRLKRWMGFGGKKAA